MSRIAALALSLGLVAGCSRSPERVVLLVETIPVAGVNASPATLAAAAKTIQRRLDVMTPRNADVRSTNDRVMIALDAEGASDWAAAKETVLSRGNLALHPVATDLPFGLELANEAIAAGIAAKSDAYHGEVWTFDGDVHAVAALLSKVTDGDDSRWRVVRDEAHAVGSGRAVIVDRKDALEHVSIASARMQETDYGVIVDVQLESADAARFEALTGSHLKRKLAIVLDGSVHSAPVVMDRIAGGRVQITMGSSASAKQGAVALAATLSGGELPFALEVRAEHRPNR